MKLKVSHTTSYKYPKKIFLEPHYLNFKPLPRPYYQLEKFNLTIIPEPTGISERVSLENNQAFQIWQNEMTDNLFIKVDIILSIRNEEYKPLEFIVDPYNKMETSGFKYPEYIGTYLDPFLQVKESDALKSYIRKAFEKKDKEIVAGLFELLENINHDWEHKRVEGEADPDAEECFQSKSGSCRDLAWMLISMLRMEGLASRFVSGYTYNKELDTGHELHAWVEVFLPGAGWVGLDPSLGLFTHQYYIPVATSFHPSHTMPVIGVYRGEVESKMATSLNIRPIGYI